MTLDRTPMNAPDEGPHKPGQCSAWGCPMWAGIKVAGDWMCAQHAFADAGKTQEVTQRLRQRLPLIRTLHRAMHTDPFAFDREGQNIAAGERMRKIGRPDLVPMSVTLAHPYRDRHTGETVQRNVTQDEGQHLALWVQRIHGVLFRECTNGVPAPQQPETIARAAGPQTVGDFLPEVAHG